MFNVIKTWSNWDVIREEIIDTHPTEDEAERDANERRKKALFCAFVVRRVADGITPCETFAPSNR